MNFSPFGGHFPASLPSMHQFAAKFTNEGGSGALQAQGVASGTMVVTGGADGAAAGIQYLRPEHGSPPAHFGASNQVAATMGVRRDAGVVTNVAGSGSGVSGKYSHTHHPQIIGWGEVPAVAVHHFTAHGVEATTVANKSTATNYVATQVGNAGVNLQQNQARPPASSPPTSWTRTIVQNASTMTTAVGCEGDLQPQDLCKGAVAKSKKTSEKRVKAEDGSGIVREEDAVVEAKEEVDEDVAGRLAIAAAGGAGVWDQGSATVADYLSRLPASTLPLSLHHFLKYSAEQRKDVGPTVSAVVPGVVGCGSQIGSPQIQQQQQQVTPKKKKKKKSSAASKDRRGPRPRPGEIRLSTALDGSTLFCCPECHMAYPERAMLEQHLSGHKLERRFVCDVCGAGLKRKEHLDQHKRGHSQERPYVCTVCLKVKNFGKAVFRILVWVNCFLVSMPLGVRCGSCCHQVLNGRKFVLSLTLFLF
ncbi:zinc finger protein 784-like isoform X3 [Ischnura elegans]|uniref:zinc finger protein 784-like isoform X3 n=1 Tax=Ischnura elegans TaxID=197161 RepID=UPI001ED89B4D|nr:zinc finger protein 784-like isoform X3 [Ischnura elegans]